MILAYRDEYSRKEPGEVEGLSESYVYSMLSRALYLAVGAIIAFIALKGVFDMLTGKGVEPATAAASGVIIFGIVLAFWFATLAFLIKSRE